MKKLLFLFSILFVSSLFAQSKMNPLIVVDAQKIGFMEDHKDLMEKMNPNDISSLTVYKDSLVCKKYGSNSGVIVITNKKFILNTFYKNNIENSPLKEKIKTPEDLLKIGLIGGNPKSKNQPYDELYKYIDTYNINEKIKKVAKITYLNPEDSIKINSEWINGAIEIDAAIE
ncbi:hypothetical protein [Flavobacterium alvei]|uniref:hypothetical protein n=1 Tax=Flavobacterium alvei TaxID=2080416 RepID=UPI0026E99888|nr:hypothetical protein [Flavobacterium alvei]